MSSGEVLGRGAYATGRIASKDECIPHPGGIELTLRAVALAGLRGEARVLDIGCGSGNTVMLLRSHGFEAKGVDRAFVPTCDIPDLYCKRASADNLPFEPESFDAVVAECSLSVMEDPLRVLSECARVLRRGGKMILCDLYARNPEAIEMVRNLGAKCISSLLVRQELEHWLQQCGLVMTCFEDHSKALREAMAQFILNHDSPEELWAESATSIEFGRITQALKQVRAGYFVSTAVRL